MSQADVWVFVLGDIGRSPRMQYHALSLLEGSSRTVRFFGHMARADGIREELLSANASGRLSFVPIPAVCVPHPEVATLPRTDRIDLTRRCDVSSRMQAQATPEPSASR